MKAFLVILSILASISSVRAQLSLKDSSRSIFEIGLYGMSSTHLIHEQFRDDYSYKLNGFGGGTKIAFERSISKHTFMSLGFGLTQINWISQRTNLIAPDTNYTNGYARTRFLIYSPEIMLKRELVTKSVNHTFGLGMGIRFLRGKNSSVFNSAGEFAVYDDNEIYERVSGVLFNYGIEPRLKGRIRIKLFVQKSFYRPMWSFLYPYEKSHSFFQLGMSIGYKLNKITGGNNESI